MSVLLAARDAAETLLRALESLASQGMREWECVIVDDGSRDATREVVRAFGDPRVRLVSQAPMGLTAALVRAAAESRGTVLARLDADDEALPERLSMQFQFLAERPEISAVGAGVQVVSHDGSPLMTKSYPADHEGLLAELDALVTPIPHSTLMMRRAVYEAVGGYRPVFAKAQDYDLLRRLARAGRLASLSAPLVRLRVSRGSMTDSTGDGEQLSYGVLAYAADKVRGCSGADPLDGASAAEFMRDFHRWYPQSRYPRMFRSRLARRAARVFLSERRPVEGTLALVRATAAYPGWPFQRAGVGPDPAKDARVWAESWARRTR